MGLAGAAAEDAEAECIRRITETQIVTGLHIFPALLLHLISKNVKKQISEAVIQPVGASEGYMFSGRPSVPLSMHPSVRP